MMKVMPSSVARIRGELIDHVSKGTPLPEEINELSEWYFWKLTDFESDEFNTFINIRNLPLDDESAAEILDMQKARDLTDTERLMAARAYARRFDEGEVFFAYEYPFEIHPGLVLLYSILSVLAGQGGPELQWIGCFPGRPAFWTALARKGFVPFNSDSGSPFGENGNAMILRSWER